MELRDWLRELEGEEATVLLPHDEKITISIPDQFVENTEEYDIVKCDDCEVGFTTVTTIFGVMGDAEEDMTQVTIQHGDTITLESLFFMTTQSQYAYELLYDQGDILIPSYHRDENGTLLRWDVGAEEYNEMYGEWVPSEEDLA
jgi:hypothetical protein